MASDEGIGGWAAVTDMFQSVSPAIAALTTSRPDFMLTYPA